MAEGFLFIYLGIVALCVLVGTIIGFACAKKSRKKGALIGAVIGITLGGYIASIAVFDTSSPTKELPVVAE